MAFIFSLLMSGFIVYGLFRLTRSADARKNFVREIRDDPLNAAFVSVYALCWLMFFWGILVPELGRVPHLGLTVVQVGGIGALAGFILDMAGFRKL